MKSTVYLLFVLFIFGNLASCKKSNTETQLPKTLISSANLYGNGNEGFTKQDIVVYDSVSWNNLMTKMNSVNNVTNEFTETNIDFTSYSVIAVFDKVLGNSGNSVNILSVIENGNNVTVKLEFNHNTGSGLTVMTQPFQIVKIPVLDKTKTVVFE